MLLLRISKIYGVGRTHIIMEYKPTKTAIQMMKSFVAYAEKLCENGADVSVNFGAALRTRTVSTPKTYNLGANKMGGKTYVTILSLLNNPSKTCAYYNHDYEICNIWRIGLFDGSFVDRTWRTQK